jgi:hypothetical protein
LKAAKKLKDGGETVAELRQKAGKGDIDVVTSTKAVEAKAAGEMNAIATTQKSLDKFKAQLENLKSHAGGKTPCLAIPTGTAIPESVQGVIDSVGGITIIYF